MSGGGDASAPPIGVLIGLGLLAAGALWADRQKTIAQRTAGQPGEVALHQTALAAVEHARAQRHLARRSADVLRQYSVDFDVRAKLESAFTEDLPKAKAPKNKSHRPGVLLLLESQERLRD